MIWFLPGRDACNLYMSDVRKIFAERSKRIAANSLRVAAIKLKAQVGEPLLLLRRLIQVRQYIVHLLFAGFR